MDWEKKNPISALIPLCKQVNYHVSNALNISDLSTTLGISISIFPVGGVRDVSYEDYQYCFSPRNIDFQINLVLGAQSIFKTPIIWPPIESKELRTQWMNYKGFVWPSVSPWGTSGSYEEERQNLMVVYYAQRVEQDHYQNKCPIPWINDLWD